MQIMLENVAMEKARLLSPRFSDKCEGDLDNFPPRPPRRPVSL